MKGDGPSSQAADDTFSDSVGTFQFFVPEMCTREISEYSGRGADIWATGIVLFALAFNKLPFESEDTSELFR